MLKHLAAALLVAAAGTAAAEQVVVSNYGVATNGMPFAVAMEKGFFKEFKASTSRHAELRRRRHDHPQSARRQARYGEAALSAVVSAVQSGADLRIISGNVHTVAEFVWVAMPDVADKQPQGPQGQAPGLHQPALDQPGARRSCCWSAGSCSRAT